MAKHTGGFCPYLSVFAIALCVAATARAEEAIRVDLGFEVYAGGFHAMTFDTQARLAPDRYSAQSSGRTEGLFDFLTRFVMTAKSEGAIGAAGLKPERHVVDSDGRWSRRSVGLTWDEQGRPLATVDPPYGQDGRNPVGAELTRGTTDLLSAVVQRALALGAEPCSGAAPVFDGRRRYNLHFAPAGAETLAANTYSAFAGTTLKCRIKLERIAGYKHDFEARNHLADESATLLWLTPMRNGRLHLPVKLVAETAWGPIIAHVVRARLGDVAVIGPTAMR